MSAPNAASTPAWSLRLLVAVALVAATLLAYAGVRNNGWVLVDDPVYVAENPKILEGLSPANVAWAFTHVHGNNWHPVTTLSHMLDAQLFGADPVPHHAENVAWHALNALLLLIVLHRLSGSFWRAAAVAALFALHPLRVESVAWVAERKDLLSGAFFLLLVLAYQHWTQRPSTARYVTVAVLLALGLMAKPMLVTAPFVLLLLDVWPLGRLRAQPSSLRDGTLAQRLTEKLPLFALVAASMVVTYLVQKSTGAVSSTSAIPMGLRVSNALVSLWTYVGKSLWPGELSAFYPHPRAIVAAPVVLAVLAGGATKLLVWLQREKRPYLLVGFYWFAGMLVPVIGIVSVGRQGWADRYSYLPTIGLAIMLVWGVAEAVQRSRALRMAAAAALLVACAALGVATARQVPRWKDSETLYRWSLHVTPVNAMAHLGLANAYMRQHRTDEALAEFAEALRLEPNDEVALEKAAVALTELKRYDEARMHYLRLLRVRESAPVWVYLANVDMLSGRASEAIEAYQRAIKLDDQQGMTYGRLARALETSGRAEEAEAAYARAVALQPERVDWHVHYAGHLMARGERAKALAEYREALKRDPDHKLALLQAAWLLAEDPDKPGEVSVKNLAAAIAMAEHLRAVENPPTVETELVLSVALQNAGRTDEAIAAIRRAIARARADGDEAAARVIEAQLRAYERAGGTR